MEEIEKEQNIARPELNIEKLWNIWQPTRAKEKLDKIIVERSMGSGKSQIEITANSKYGPMTTETQKVLYALFKISEELNNPRGFSFSLRRVARILGKTWGTSVKELIELALYQLRTTFFVMTNYFYDSETKETLKLIETFHILSALELVRKENHGHVTTEECYCEFHEFIYKNLKSNYVKPLLLDVVLEIGDDGIAQILYTHLDLILTETNPYKRRSERLFKELNLVGIRYKKLSNRKETLERIIKALEGKRLSKGGVLHLSLELTVDQKDYNLVCERIEKTDMPKALVTEKELELDMPLNDNTYKLVINEQELLEKEFVRLFFKVFKIRRKKATEKELSQAKELIDSHQLNLKEYKHIMDYAILAAKKTNYKPQYFGGIIQYVEEALAQYPNKGKHKGNGNTQTNSGNCSLCQFTDGYLYITYENGTTDRIVCPHDQEAINSMGANNNFHLGF